MHLEGRVASQNVPTLVRNDSASAKMGPLCYFWYCYFFFCVWNGLTLNSPPHPSSSSSRYPSTAGPRWPPLPPPGGCQATVTLLFSALHSSGINWGAPGAVKQCSKIFNSTAAAHLYYWRRFILLNCFDTFLNLNICNDNIFGKFTFHLITLRRKTN